MPRSSSSSPAGESRLGGVQAGGRGTAASDFEPGLYRRERAAYLLSEYLKWGIVPPTVIREDSPLGVGSLQWFIEGDLSEHYFTLYADSPETHRALAGSPCSTASPTILTARADTCCAATTDACGASTMGCAFRRLQTAHRDLGLRGRTYPRALLKDITPLAEAVPPDVAELLDDTEVTALQRRVRRLLHERVLPGDPTGMRYPWPLV